MRWPALVSLVAVGAVVSGIATPIAVADDDAVSAGTSCRAEQLGTTTKGADGTTLRCLATGEGGFTWSPEAGAVSAIAELQKQGYTVNIERTGDGPLDSCKVVSVHNPQTTTQTVGDPLGAPHTPGGVTTITLSRSISVALDCTGG